MKRLILLPAMCLCLSGCAVIEVLDCIDPIGGSCSGVYKMFNPDYKPKLRKRRVHVSPQIYRDQAANNPPVKKPSKTWSSTD